MRARLIRAFLSELQRDEVLEHCQPDDLIEVTAHVLIIAANGARLSLDDLLQTVCGEFERIHMD